MNWKSLLVEAIIVALTTFASVFLRGMMDSYAPEEDFA